MFHYFIDSVGLLYYRNLRERMGATRSFPKVKKMVDRVPAFGFLSVHVKNYLLRSFWPGELEVRIAMYLVIFKIYFQ